jgi:hypothetical protein
MKKTETEGMMKITEKDEHTERACKEEKTETERQKNTKTECQRKTGFEGKEKTITEGQAQT